MDFSGLGNEISEISEIKTESNREFSRESLDKFDELFRDDIEDVDEEDECPENVLSKDIADRRFDTLFDDEEKEQKIQDFVDEKIDFDEVKEIYAGYYAEAVNDNKPWSWGEDIPGGDELTGNQRKAVCECAREKGMVSEVPTREENGKRYADFSEYKVFECVLDKEDWTKKDSEQFDKCNKMLKNVVGEDSEPAEQFTTEQLEQINRGEIPSGYTWHHSEVDGTMQLVPYGVHNSTFHHGGRSEGNWADAPR